MNENNPSDTKKNFRVKVGHTAVTVPGTTPQEAVRQARKQLCMEMPRMWDVIQAMSDDRFSVAPEDQ